MEHKLPNPNKPLNSWIFLQETGLDLHMRDGEIWVSGDCSKPEAQAALDAHNPEA